MLASLATTAAMPHTKGFANPQANVAHMHIMPGMTVADFGSGSGAYIFPIAKALEGSGVVYAIDAQQDLLRRIHHEATKKSLSTVSVIWGDLEKSEGSKLPSASCDVVLLSNIVFQVEHREGLFSEAKRILKPEGKLVVIDWSDSFNNMGPIKEHVVTEEAAKALAHAQFFSYVESFNAGAHHWGAVFTPAPHLANTYE